MSYLFLKFLHEQEQQQHMILYELCMCMCGFRINTEEIYRESGTKWWKSYFNVKREPNS